MSAGRHRKWVLSFKSHRAVNAPFVTRDAVQKPGTTGACCHIPPCRAAHAVINEHKMCRFVALLGTRTTVESEFVSPTASPSASCGLLT